MNEIERDDELIAAAGKLSTEISPARDLWPGIEDAIARPGRPAETNMNALRPSLLVWPS